ncbi:WD40 domain-containing protein, partial [Oryctes borbonicus]
MFAMKLANSVSDDIGSSESEDCDTCDETTIKQIFNLKCETVISKTINKNNYVLYLDGSLNSTPNVAVGLSNNTVDVYNFSNNQLAKLETFEASENVVGVKSCKENENIFYIGSKDCQIEVVDLRDGKCKSQFKDTTIRDACNYKPLNCFDISSNGLLLCGGTNLYDGDAYILFWDVRKANLLGAYWESHTDDITQVTFHPEDPNKLISGSTDGLINLLDISNATEDDALLDSFNTESSVERLSWFIEENKDAMACITHTSDLQVWKLDDVQPYAHFRKEEIRKDLKRRLEGYCYIASMQVNNNNALLALVGSNYGNGECLRSFG